MSDKKLSVKRVRKEKIVANLIEKASRAKGFVFTNYQGLTHKQLETLKRAIKTLDADFVATKNTLLKLALEQTQNSRLQLPSAKADGGQAKLPPSPKLRRAGKAQNLQGATATLFLYGDPVMPLKELAKLIKEFNLPSIKFGILDGLQISAEQVLQLSTLPSKQTLLTQLVINLKSPIFGLHRSLNWNIQKLVMTLSAIKQKNPKL